MGPRRKHAIFHGHTLKVAIFLLVGLGELTTAETKVNLETTLQYIEHEEQPLIGLAIDEQREPPLFYDTFFTVVYEMDTPSWTSTDLRLEMPPSLTNISDVVFECNDTYNTTDLWATTLCPITQKLNEILDGFAQEMKVFETFNASETKLDSQFSSCHEVKPHFSNHIIDEIEIELYLIQVILDCPIADVIHHKLNVTQPNKAKYLELLKMFIETHISPRFRIVGYSKYAISTNILLSLHTTELLDFLLDSFSWTTSINTCNSQRIPRLLLPQEKLKGTLAEIETKVDTKGFKLAIPISDISNYYKLQIADCVMTTAGSYIIRLLVPLVKKTANYKLVKINPVPFLNKDVKSSRTMICQHRTLEGSLVLDGTTRQPLARVKCEEAELCRVPPNGDRPVFSKCYTAALLNDTNGMLESCHMACLPYDPVLLPYIKRIRSDQFAIVGTSSADITVKCKREKDPLKVNNIPKAMGSLLITLPCACYLEHRLDIYEINGPCEFQLEMRPVRPMGWTYDILLEHFHHKRRLYSKDGDEKSNGSRNIYPPDEESEDEDFNEVVLCNQSSSESIWPICLLYVLLLIIGIILAGGFYTLRNVYIRMGQLEVSTALSMTTRSHCSEPEYSRNAPVTFNARTATQNSNELVC